jgi:hypothetical protein
MPESSLTEDAEITSGGNVSAASAQAAIVVDVTGIPSRTAGLGMIIDTHMRVVDGPIFSGRPGVRPPVELLVERDTPVLTNRDRSISAPSQDIAGSGGSPDAGTYRGLPRRVRQANLSPHLRSSPSSGTAAHSRDPEIRSPEQARSLRASLQSGWERGREAEVRDSEATVGGQETAGGLREAPQEEA